MLNALEKVMYPNGKTKALGDITSGSVSSIIDEVHANTSAITSITAQLSSLVDDVGTNTSAISSINTKLGHLTYDSETEKYYMTSGLNVQWHLVAQHHLRANDFDLGENNAGFRNSIYRGKNLGTSVTLEQWDAIQYGTFEGLFIGDYWTLNGTVYRIADFDYYFKSGDTECTDHHVVVVPDVKMDSQKMNDSNVTTGAYVGSKMYTTNIATAKAKIKADFGNSHILSHREYLANAVTNGRQSGGGWYDSEIELMTESMVYGSPHFTAAPDGSTIPVNYTVSCKQLNLFRYRPDLISNRQSYWLRDVVSSSLFALVAISGYCVESNASNTDGIRPAFCIYSPTTQQNSTRKKASKKKGD